MIICLTVFCHPLQTAAAYTITVASRFGLSLWCTQVRVVDAAEMPEDVDTPQVCGKAALVVAFALCYVSSSVCESSKVTRFGLISLAKHAHSCSLALNAHSRSLAHSCTLALWLSCLLFHSCLLSCFRGHSSTLAIHASSLLSRRMKVRTLTDVDLLSTLESLILRPLPSKTTKCSPPRRPSGM